MPGYIFYDGIVVQGYNGMVIVISCGCISENTNSTEITYKSLNLLQTLEDWDNVPVEYTPNNTSTQPSPITTIIDEYMFQITCFAHYEIIINSVWFMAT